MKPEAHVLVRCRVLINTRRVLLEGEQRVESKCDDALRLLEVSLATEAPELFKHVEALRRTLALVHEMMLEDTHEARRRITEVLGPHACPSCGEPGCGDAGDDYHRKACEASAIRTLIADGEAAGIPEEKLAKWRRRLELADYVGD